MAPNTQKENELQLINKLLIFVPSIYSSVGLHASLS